MAAVPREWRLEVHFTPPGAVAEMQQWLGFGRAYYPQIGDDLGKRLVHATAGAFSRGAAAVIVIGGNCPGPTMSRPNGKSRNLPRTALRYRADVTAAETGAQNSGGGRPARVCRSRNAIMLSWIFSSNQCANNGCGAKPLPSSNVSSL